MPKKERLTANSDETEISSLLSGDNIFVIPYFQRAYKWKPERLKQLNKDLLNLVDNTDLHFLGALIVHGRRNNPSDPDFYEVIDGQQRITTLFLYICAAVKVLCELKEYTEAESLFFKYLVIGREIKASSNIKLHSSKDDRAQLNYVFNDLLKDSEMKRRAEKASVRLLPATGSDNGPLRKNYGIAYDFYKSRAESGGVSAVMGAYTALLDLVSVVQIDVTDPTNGPKIFDRLNSRQEPMTIGDLVKNEIFSKIADESPEQIEGIHHDHWAPFYKKFQQGSRNLFDSYFFPYGLIQNPNLRKSEVYASLRERWVKESAPAKMIAALSEFQNAFIDIVCGQNTQEHTKPVAQLFFELHKLGAPGSTLPFLMQLSNSIKCEKVPQSEGMQALEVIQSFLVRRAICGHEPTGLHAVFKRLWIDCEEKPSEATVTNAIKKHKTVVWPTADEVKNAIKSRPLAGAGIARYLLTQYDISLKGDNPKMAPWIEHVLPVKPVDSWFEKFTPEEHEKMHDLLANLIPLSGEMNSSLGNREYAAKRQRYMDDSAFKAARTFAIDHDDWSPELLKRRAEKLAEWAIARWPH